MDRKAVDQVLGLTWKAFLRRHPWEQEDVEHIISVAVEPEPDWKTIRSILNRQTLRWTVCQAVPALYFVKQIVHHVRMLKRSGADLSFW